MEDFDEVVYGTEPFDLACKVAYGDFNPSHRFFWFNGYCNLCSGDWSGNMPIYTGDIARYIVDNEDALGDPEIEAILAGEDDEDE